MNYKFSADGFDSPEDWADNNEDPDYVELAEAGESKVSCKMFEDEKIWCIDVDSHLVYTH